MKIFKTMTTAALLLIGMAVLAQAPGNRQRRSATDRAKTETERVVKALELTADQTIKLQEVNLKFAVKDSVAMAARRNSQSAGEVDRDAMMKAREADRAVKTVEVKAILTDAQKVKYDALQKEMMQRGGNRQGGQGGPGGQPQGGGMN